MKKILLLLLALCLAGLSATAQTAKGKNHAATQYIDNSKAEVPATYPGGPQALLSHISEALVYPAQELDKKTEGVVVLRFIVKKNGKIDDIHVLRSLSPACDEAAIEAIRKLKRFTPARQGSKRIPVHFTLPVRYRFR